jgi:TonB-dependent receptor
VQTLKPLDAPYGEGQSLLFSGSLRATQNDVHDETDPRASGVMAYKNADETIGFFLAALYSEGTLWADEIFNRGAYRVLNMDNDGDGVQDGTLDGDDQDGDGIGDGVYSPSSTTRNPIQGERNLTSFSGAVQFRPNDKLEINIDALYSDYELLSNRNNYRTFWSQGGGIYRGLFTPESVAVEHNTVVYMNPAQMTGADTRVRARLQNLQFDNVSDYFMSGFNAKWTEEDWEISFDYAHSETDFYQLIRSMGTRDARSLDQSQISYDLRGRLIPYIDLGPQGTDLANFTTEGGVGFGETQSEADENSFRLDFAYDVNDRLTLRFGVRHTDTFVDVRRARNLLQYFDCSAENGMVGADRTAMNDAAYANGGTFGPFLPDQDIANHNWPLIDFAAGIAAAPECYHSITAVGTDLFTADLESQYDESGLNNGQSFWIEEQTLALYGQLDFEVELGDMPVTGNVGIRAVETKDNALGNSSLTLYDPEGILEDVVTGGVGQFSAKTRRDYLPSLNLNFEIRDNLALRLSAQQTVTRPDYIDLVTRENLRRQNPDAPLFDPFDNGTGSAGNAALEPYTAWQYDATLEYYTENGGAFYVSLFYKDVKDYILGQSLENIELPGHTDILWDVNQKINFSDGTVKGYELGLNQPLSFLPIEGFGVQANYTNVDSSFDAATIGDAGFGFPGSSEDNFNLVAYYDQGKINARLAYVYRGDYLVALGAGQGGDRAATAQFTQEQNRLDAKVDYRLTDNMTLTLSGTNLTGQDRENFVANPNIFRDFVERGRTYRLGIRAKF